MRADSSARRWQPIVMLLVVALVAWFVSLRRETPALSPADAPAQSFSGARALEVLTRLAGDQTPHGVGTTASADVRHRVVAELEALGLDVELQETFVCNGTVCAPVVNIIAEIAGRESGPAVLMASHYDSVHAGPGIGDDLHAVAITIETARAILSRGAPRRTVMLLIDEGEEVGLLGAQAFVNEHRAVGRIGAVVNVEARGTSAQSSMFQTSENNAALVGAYLDADPSPRATSLAVEVYRRMPNNTDLTVFLNAGLPGLNFAFIGDVARYHTPLDDLEHLDPGSLEHQGQRAFAAVTALADAELPLRAADNLVYADVVGLFVVRWPESWSVPLAVGLVVLIVVLAAVGNRRSVLRGPRCVLGAVAAFAIVLLIVSTAFGVVQLVGAAQGEDLPALAHPLPLRVALWAMGALVAVSVTSWLKRWAEPLELAVGVWIVWGAVGVAMAATLPGASIHFILPISVAAVGLVLAVARPQHAFSGVALGAAAMTLTFADLGFALEDAFGLAAAPAVAAPLAVVFTAVGPGVATDRPGWLRLGGAGLAVTLVAGAWASLVDVYDEASPRRVAITHYEDRDTGEALDVLMAQGDPGEVMLGAAEFGPEAEPVLPWLRWPVHAAGAPMSAAPAPELDAAGFRSPRGADRAVLLFPAGALERVTVEGRPVAQSPGEPITVYLFGVPRQGVAVRIHGGAPGTEAVVVDCGAELPASTQRLVDARPADASTFQWGDASCIKTTVPIPLAP